LSVVVAAAMSVLVLAPMASAHDPGDPERAAGDDFVVVWGSGVDAGGSGLHVGGANAITYFATDDAGYIAEGPHRIEITRGDRHWVVGDDAYGCSDDAVRAGDEVVVRLLGPGMIAVGPERGCL
jgi:hypothetical protein